MATQICGGITVVSILNGDRILGLTTEEAKDVWLGVIYLADNGKPEHRDRRHALAAQLYNHYMRGT